MVLGGGLEHFDMPTEQGNQTILDLARANGYQVVNRLPDPAVAQAASDQTNSRWLGLFASSHLPVKWRGSQDRKAEKPAPSLLNRLNGMIGEVTLPLPMTCEPNPLYAGTPALVELTRFAIDQLKGSEQGFVLVVESASIDKQSHERKACGQIGELEQLDDTVALALEFAAKDADTLVLVTADHGQAAQLVPEQSLFTGFGVPVYSPGYIVRLKTPEGALMAVNYATNDFFVEEHTGVQVPLFANAAGVGAIPTLINQHDLYGIMMTFLGLDH